MSFFGSRVLFFHICMDITTLHSGHGSCTYFGSRRPFKPLRIYQRERPGPWLFIHWHVFRMLLYCFRISVLYLLNLLRGFYRCQRITNNPEVHTEVMNGHLWGGSWLFSDPHGTPSVTYYDAKLLGAGMLCGLDSKLCKKKKPRSPIFFKRVPN